MSIILKGIDLPSADDITGVKLVVDKIHGQSVQFVLPCQAIQIPKGHGDLIDRNQVFTYSHRDVKNLEEVPVILEEEW